MPTHASFFSGAGGLDLGLERAGWRTVSFSEIDPYACAVLAERWPGVPNLGDIAGLHGHPVGGEGVSRPQPEPHGREDEPGIGWADATLWSGGFPCQDLSVAGKRAGFGGARSSLAFTFLDLVRRHRPPAILLENVPGLLSSHRGRDMAALLGGLVELGYGVAYRILDARYFGVPQRRRRVFIVGLRSGPDDADGRVAAERAAQVLAVGTRCGRHPPAGSETGPNAADGIGAGVSRSLSTSQQRIDSETESFIIGTVREHVRPGSNSDFTVISPPPDAGRDGAPDGLAGRLDYCANVAGTLRSGHSSPRGDGADNLIAFIKAGRAQSADAPESWREGDVMPLNATVEDDPLLPLGLDSHRYRSCGNGVVAPVAEWLGRRLMAALAGA